MLKKIVLVLTALFFISSTSVFADSNQTLNVVVKYDVMVQKWFKEVVASYEKAHPAIKVNLMTIGGNEANYFTKLALLTKSSTSLDVIYEDSSMLHSDVDANLLAPINVKNVNAWNNFFPSLQKSVTVNGKVYALPLSTDSRGLYYNVNIFKKAGIKIPWQPKNWNDILNAARQIKKKVPGIFPLALTTTASGESTYMQTAEMLLYGTGNTLYENGKWVVTSKGFLNMLKFISTVYKEHLGVRMGIALNPQYGNILTTTLAPKQQVGIILDGCWLDGIWLKRFPETSKVYKFIPMPTEFGQAPKYTSMSGGWDLAISAKSSKKELALNFINFALNKKNLLRYVLLVQNLSTRKDVAASKEYPEHLKQATKFLEFTHFRPANQHYPFVSTQLQTAVESVAIGNPPLQVMNAYAASVERGVGKGNVVRLYK
ncbi:MAG TPA: extracellular solute-binding protein [Victivallales bacterium]|nr:extracellular solute-binding protein [Victivallales bacterium]